ncbi:hypothetical protein T440DRAFT_384760 [Plenodomus tracheiphilus IPT5]|uniref:RING-type domain-containing protein n=1 Tax=Plenodomus tracheiphilus IPT5 TaxID=1408161 RepID=A0A6A7BPF3_9PLEO|nr:hypothetical protein T440DRAFT_384760 [Plenodomus tracheiphilus IPT5]
MARPALDGDHEIIDLSADAEDDGISNNEPIWNDFSNDLPEFEDLLEGLPQPQLPEMNDRETIDLTEIPDIDVPPSDHPVIDEQTITQAECLQMVLNVLPDISVDHALETINERTTDATRTIARCELMIAGLLDGEEYPKAADKAKNKKRKRDDTDSLSDYEREDRDPTDKAYEQDALELLKDEFLSVPKRHLIRTLKKERTLFKAFGVLDEQWRTRKQIATPFSRISKARAKHGAELILIERGSQVPKELHAAKKRKEVTAAKRQRALETDQAEEMNLQQAQATDQMGECACCFDDVPLNRMISCNGHTAHFYCKNCPRQQIEIQIGQSRCRPTCFGVTDCTGTFSRSQLQQVLPKRTFERLDHMQQLEDLKAAGLDFLSECPFCDFKMECPPIEVDKEFRCENHKCGKTSCRLCDKETHIPLTCEESKKDGQLTFRHIIEEAMSAALIRYCNRCKQPFVKEMGCNKMTCSHCRNVQCYVCSKNVANYNHFGEAQNRQCPLHENIEDRHEQEVKKAADEAMAKLRAENPDLSETDLLVQVSDRVKQAEEARKGRGAVAAGAFPIPMVGNQLHHRPLPEQVVGAAGNREQRQDLHVLPLFHGGQPPRPAPHLELPTYMHRYNSLRLLVSWTYSPSHNRIFHPVNFYHHAHAATGFMHLINIARNERRFQIPRNRVPAFPRWLGGQRGYDFLGDPNGPQLGPLQFGPIQVPPPPGVNADDRPRLLPVIPQAHAENRNLEQNQAAPENGEDRRRRLRQNLEEMQRVRGGPGNGPNA